MEQLSTNERTKCRLLAADLRQDAERTRIPGFAERLLIAALDLEQHADGLGASIFGVALDS
jgi:hypothetical protein